jgi:hypothetical protein
MLHLHALAPGLPERGVPDRVFLERLGDSVQITLARADGSPAEVRWIPASASCDDLAGAVAVVVATWRGELRATLPAPALEEPARATRAPPATADTTLCDLGAGALALVSDPGSTVGALADASLFGCQAGLGGQLALLGSDTRSLSLDGGRADFTRFALAVGPRYRLRASGWRADLELQALVAVLLLNGSGYPVAYQNRDVDPGLAIGLRVGAPTRLYPWLRVAVVDWLREQTAHLAGHSDTVTLPRLELLLALGVDLGFGPGPQREAQGGLR